LAFSFPPYRIIERTALWHDNALSAFKRKKARRPRPWVTPPTVSGLHLAYREHAGIRKVEHDTLYHEPLWECRTAIASRGSGATPAACPWMPHGRWKNAVVFIPPCRTPSGGVSSQQET